MTSQKPPQIQYPYAQLAKYDDGLNYVLIDSEKDIPSSCTKGVYVLNPTTGEGKCLEFKISEHGDEAEDKCYTECEAVGGEVPCSMLPRNMYYCSRNLMQGLPKVDFCGSNTCGKAKCFTFNENGTRSNKCLVFKDMWNCQKVRKEIKDAGEYCKCVEVDSRNSVLQGKYYYRVFCENDNIRTPQNTTYGDYFKLYPEEIVPRKISTESDNNDDAVDAGTSESSPTVSTTKSNYGAAVVGSVVVVLLALAVSAAVITVFVLRQRKAAVVDAVSAGGTSTAKLASRRRAK